MRLELDEKRVVIVADTSDTEAHLRDLASRRCTVLTVEDPKQAAPATTRSPASSPIHPKASEGQ